MTYKQIQKEHRKLYNKTVKSCWIADVKRELGMPVRMAYNRENKDIIKNKCPEKFKKTITEIIKRGNAKKQV